ncbi:bluetail domain-containing putative surface protein [Synechococcus sp. UW140]|uniref:bluetail domain-containing putative surface protein n=1 Tax=Synechococcus sp. UW140 TaxID=368503 RepID=UPI00313849D7
MARQQTTQSRPAPNRPIPAINLTGTDNADVMLGDANSNTYSSGAGDDLMYASAGSDSLSGGAGADIIDYSRVNADLTFSRGGVLTKTEGLGTDIISNFDIEVIKANPKRTNTIDGSTGTTASLNVDLANNLLTINNLPGIGSASLTVEHFQNVLGSENADIITGSNAENDLSGGAGNDLISGLSGSDKLTGGAGNDTFSFGRGDSLLTGFDRITDLEIGVDQIDGLVANSSVRNFGSVRSLNAGDLGQVLNSRSFGANLAASFSLGSGSGTRTFLALNDNRAGFQANNDMVIEITGYSGNLSDLQIV